MPLTFPISLFHHLFQIVRFVNKYPVTTLPKLKPRTKQTRQWLPSQKLPLSRRPNSHLTKVLKTNQKARTSPEKPTDGSEKPKDGSEKPMDGPEYNPVAVVAPLPASKTYAEVM